MNLQLVLTPKIEEEYGIYYKVVDKIEQLF